MCFVRSLQLHVSAEFSQTEEYGMEWNINRKNGPSPASGEFVEKTNDK